MDDNPALAFILDGIDTLTELADFDAMTEAAKNQKKFAGAKGNSAEAIRKNEELFDYSQVAEKDLPMAKKWFKAPKTTADKSRPEYITAYHQYRVWNVPKVHNRFLI